MKTAILVGVLLVLTGCAHSDEWSRRDTVMQWTVTGLMVADAVTTSRITDAGHEEGRGVAREFLGAHPSDGDTLMYFGTLAISSYFIARSLPAKWRPYYQGFVILDHGSAVVGNCGKELC